MRQILAAAIVTLAFVSSVPALAAEQTATCFLLLIFMIVLLYGNVLRFVFWLLRLGFERSSAPTCISIFHGGSVDGGPRALARCRDLTPANFISSSFRVRSDVQARPPRREFLNNDHTECALCNKSARTAGASRWVHIRSSTMSQVGNGDVSRWDVSRWDVSRWDVIPGHEKIRGAQSV